MAGKNSDNIRCSFCNKTQDQVRKLIAGPAGVFGSVSSKEIAEEIKKQLGYDVDKKKVLLDTPIKQLGVTSVGVKLHAKVTTEVKVHVKEL